MIVSVTFLTSVIHSFFVFSSKMEFVFGQTVLSVCFVAYENNAAGALLLTEVTNSLRMSHVAVSLEVRTT